MPLTNFCVPERYKYLEGFGSYHQSEAVPGANTVAINSPQIPPLGLCTERLSGGSFTAPRAENQHTWLYRVTSSMAHRDFSPYNPSNLQSREDIEVGFTPNALRWSGFPTEPDTDWISSQRAIATSGDPTTKTGLTYLMYAASKDMAPNTVFFSSDGDYLIVPHAGTLDIQTELGRLLVRQGEIAVIPRGIRYRVTLPQGPSRGYICELHQGHFQLPELGPLGSCSLANVRDFQVPTAHFDGHVVDNIAIANSTTSSSDGNQQPWTIITRFAKSLWSCEQPSTPFDVVAWHGTYYPYKYDLGRFSVIGSVLYDHPDPSIFTVLTAPSHRVPGTAVVDFGVIMPRWLVMEGTYWEPYFHRNAMAEFAAPIILDQNMDSLWNKSARLGFAPFAAQLNNSMVPHGMDDARHKAARARDTGKPVKAGTEGFAIFIFESEAMMGITKWAHKAAAGSSKLAKI